MLYANLVFWYFLEYSTLLLIDFYTSFSKSAYKSRTQLDAIARSLFSSSAVLLLGNRKTVVSVL